MTNWDISRADTQPGEPSASDGVVIIPATVGAAPRTEAYGQLKANIVAAVTAGTVLPSPDDGDIIVGNGGAWNARSLNGAPIGGVAGNGAVYYQSGSLRFIGTAGRGEGDYLGVAGGAMAWLEHPAHILHGAGVPTAAQGETDDYYLQTSSPPRWYQKTTAATWALQYTWPVSSGGQTAQQVLDLIAGAVPFWARIDEHDVSLADIPVINMTTHVTAAIDDSLGNSDWRTPDTATLNIGGLISANPTLQDRIAIADESDSQTVRQAVLSQVRTLVVPEWGDGVNTWTGRTHVRLRGHVGLEQDTQRVYLNFPDRGIAAEIDTGNSPDGKIWSAADLRDAAETWGGVGALAFVSSDASLEGAGTPADTIGIAPAILAGISDLGTDLATAQIKLAGIEPGATADQTDAEHVAAIDAALGSTAWQGGGGVGDAFSWATVGNTDRIPDAKIPIGVTRDQELITALTLSLADIGLTLAGTTLGIVTDGSGAATQVLPSGGGGISDLFVPTIAEVTYEAGGATINVDGPGADDAPAGMIIAFQYRGAFTAADTAVSLVYNGATAAPIIVKDGATNRSMTLNDFARYEYFLIQKAAPNFIRIGGNYQVDTGGTPLSAEALYPFLYAQILAGDFITRSPNVAAGTITYGVNMPISGLTDVPSLGSAAQVLAVNAGETAAEWVNQTGGGGLDAFGWATEGNTDRIPTAKMSADAVVGGLQVASNTLIIDFAEGISQTLNLPNALTGGSLTLTGQQLELYVTRHTGGVISLGSVTLPAGGGGGDDAYDWATVGNTDRIPRSKSFGNTVVGITRGGGQLVFELAGGIYLPFDEAYRWATEGNTDRIPEGKMFADTLVGLQVTANTLVADNAQGSTETLNLPNAVTGGALTLVGQQLSLSAYRHTGGAISLGSVTLPAGGGGGDDAYDWATVGNTSTIPDAKIAANIARDTELTAALGELGLTLSGQVLGIVTDGSGADTQTLPGGGSGDDAFDWATVGNSERIPLAKSPGNLLHTVATESYNLLRFTEADGTEHDITINLPAAGSVIESMLAMHNTPANAQVIAWDLNNDRMYWANAATDQRIVDLINDHNPTAVPGAVTQTGGGDRGSGPRFGWEDHTHQIVGIQMDDIPGTPTTTVPDDARLLVELADGTNRKITGANARTSLGGGDSTVTLISGDFTLGVAQTTLGSGTPIEADKEIAISVYAKGGNRADAVGYWQGPSSVLRETTTNGPIWIPVGANRRVEARVSNTTDYYFQLAVQSGQATMGGEWYVRVQERGPQGERGPAGTSGLLDIDGLTVLSGNLANGDDLVVYDDSAGAVRKVSMTAVGAYASRISGFITTTATPADADWWYFGDDSNGDNMRRVSGANLKTYIGGDTGQVTENTRVVEHILDRLAAFDQRVSDIDQTSVDDTLAFVTTVNMKTNASEPTDADRTTGSYSAALTSLTIGPNETGFVLFRIGIDEQPNLYEPQLRDGGNDTIIQNLTSLGFATELSETAGHRYFYLPLFFPVEDTGTLRMRKTTRTAHHDWLGTVSVVQKYRYALGTGPTMTSPDTFDDDDLLIIGANATTVTQQFGYTTIQSRFGDLPLNSFDGRRNALLPANTSAVDGSGVEIAIYRDDSGHLLWDPRFIVGGGTDYLYVTKIGGAFS